ncbi:hypothetical protein QL285_009015 [Trifolium repens]|nr:hypothetical protein QL285_009015 [Trifolium repens]
MCYHHLESSSRSPAKSMTKALASTCFPQALPPSLHPRNAFRSHEGLVSHYHRILGSSQDSPPPLQTPDWSSPYSLKKHLLPTIIGFLDSSTSFTTLFSPRIVPFPSS